MASITRIRKTISQMTLGEIEREIASYKYQGCVRVHELRAERNARLASVVTLTDAELVAAIRAGDSSLRPMAKDRGLSGCDGCAGDGRYLLRNGSYGTCFRCAKKGYQTSADRKRNAEWDAKHAAAKLAL